MQRRSDICGIVALSSPTPESSAELNAQVTCPPIPARVVGRWRAAHQHSPLQFLQQVPSWLLSLILHLGFMLILASLVVPYGPHTRLDQLFVTFGDAEAQDLSRSPIVVENPQAREENEQQDPAETSPVQEQAEQRAPPPPTKSNQPNVDLQQVGKQLRDFFQNQIVEKPAEARMVRIEPVARVESTFDWSLHDEQNDQAHDEIVDQFILYDTGRLRGRAGRDAARQFQQLGASAIPALVRGLNRSASIHASCPVGVISAKLANTLRSTDDRRLIDYALKNLGRDIPRGAPHGKRVRALRNQFRNELGLRQDQFKQRLGELGWSVDQDSIDRIASCFGAQRVELVAALNDEDAAVRRAATLTILLRSGEFDSADQAKLGWAIADLIDSTSDPQQMDLLQQTARSLAGRQDLLTDLSGSEWRSFWEHQMQVHLMAGLSPARQIRELHSRDPVRRRAVMEAIVRSQQKISDSQKFQMSDLIIASLDSDSTVTSDLAHQTLVKLAGKDRGGRSAQAWREYWIDTHFERTVVPRSESHLRQAVFLEQRGKRAAAAKKYRELIEGFPGTPAAKSAADRLESIIRRSRS